MSDTEANPNRAFLESTIAKARAAIAYASPAADMSYAKAVLFFAEMKLDALDKRECVWRMVSGPVGKGPLTMRQETQLTPPSNT